MISKGGAANRGIQGAYPFNNAHYIYILIGKTKLIHCISKC